MRLPLEELCLRIKVCDLGPIKEVLASALDAPHKDLVDNAIETLQEVRKSCQNVELFRLTSNVYRYKHCQLTKHKH